MDTLVCKQNLWAGTLTLTRLRRGFGGQALSLQEGREDEGEGRRFTGLSSRGK